MVYDTHEIILGWEGMLSETLSSYYSNYVSIGFIFQKIAVNYFTSI